MKNKKKKNRVLRSDVPASRGLYNRGVRATVMFMRIIYTTYRAWKKRGDMPAADASELSTVFNCSEKILVQHFKVTKEAIEKIWNTLDGDYAEKEATALYTRMSSKIIMPGPSKAGGAVILPPGSVDLSKVAEEVKRGKRK